MPDSGMQARTSSIMRVPAPHDPDGRPCLPTHHPRSQPPHPPRPHRPGHLQDADAPHLLTDLAAVPDPRAARGRRHALVAILGLAAAAVLGGARSIAAIAEWAADAPQPVRAALGARHHAPDPSPSRPRPPSAGPFPAWTPMPWPLRSAPGWGSGTGAAQTRSQPAAGGRHRRQDPPRRPPGQAATAAGRTCWPAWTTPPARCWPTPGRRRTQEVPALAPLLADLDSPGPWSPPTRSRPTRRPPGFLVASKHAHYLLVVKANQPTLLARCTALAWHHVPVLDRTGDAATAASRSAPSRPSASVASASPTRCAATPATHTDPGTLGITLGTSTDEPAIATQRRSLHSRLRAWSPQATGSRPQAGRPTSCSAPDGRPRRPPAGWVLVGSFPLLPRFSGQLVPAGRPRGLEGGVVLFLVPGGGAGRHVAVGWGSDMSMPWARMHTANARSCASSWALGGEPCWTALAGRSRRHACQAASHPGAWLSCPIGCRGWDRAG
jgi:DDE_Tnp_1-associated